MLTRCDECGGKFDKDEDWEMSHCGGTYEELCDYCVDARNEEREEREEQQWLEKVRQWELEDLLNDLEVGP